MSASVSDIFLFFYPCQNCFHCSFLLFFRHNLCLTIIFLFPIVSLIGMITARYFHFRKCGGQILLCFLHIFPDSAHHLRCRKVTVLSSRAPTDLYRICHKQYQSLHIVMYFQIHMRLRRLPENAPNIPVVVVIYLSDIFCSVHIQYSQITGHLHQITDNSLPGQPFHKWYIRSILHLGSGIKNKSGFRFSLFWQNSI